MIFCIFENYINVWTETASVIIQLQNALNPNMASQHFIIVLPSTSSLYFPALHDISQHFSSQPACNCKESLFSDFSIASHHTKWNELKALEFRNGTIKAFSLFKKANHSHQTRECRRGQMHSISGRLGQCWLSRSALGQRSHILSWIKTYTITEGSNIFNIFKMCCWYIDFLNIEKLLFRDHLLSWDGRGGPMWKAFPLPSRSGDAS